jgi:hypothetical protein
MRHCSLAVILLLAAFQTPASAAKLVYTGYDDNSTNPLIAVGRRVYTIAVQVLPGDGTDVLAIGLTFDGVAGTAPVQLTKTVGGFRTYQESQDNLDWGVVPASKVALGRAADTWFYSSYNGQLLGDDGLPVVGDPKLNALHLSPNPFALLWQPTSTPNFINDTTGTSMSITAFWGLPWSDPSDPIRDASLVGPGVYPIAQVVIPAGGSVGLAVGPTTGIAFNGAFYNVLGGPIANDPNAQGAFISYDANAYVTNPLAIGPIVLPEPSSILLATFGTIALLALARRRSR